MILYVGNFIFPKGNAAGKRVLGNMMAMLDAGYEVSCLCFSKEKSVGKDMVSKHQYELITYYSIPYCNGVSRLSNKIPYKAFLSVISELEKSGKTIENVVMYESLASISFNLKVIRYCKKHSIKVLYDLVDWFDSPAKTNMARYFVKKLELYLLEHYVFQKCDGWITISTYLQKRMPRLKHTLLLPPLADSKRVALERQSDDKIVVSYASFISSKSVDVSLWKDRVDTVIDCFYDLLTKYGISNFCLWLIGFKSEELIEMLIEEKRNEYTDKLKTLEKNVVFYGHCTNSEVQNIIGQSDFTILLRDKKTCTNAGFPTKVSESISIGIPVLSNETSDIANYITNGENGYILSDPCDYEILINDLKKCMTIDHNSVLKMKQAAYNTDAFYYKTYVNDIKSYFSNLNSEEV